MRRLIMWNLITLEGFFEGATKWDLDFHDLVWGDELEQLGIEQTGGADLLLFGRVTYEGMAVDMSRRHLAVLTVAFAACFAGACRPAAPEPAPHVEYIVSPLTAGLDLPFSEIVRVGDMLYLSGMVGIRPGTLELVPGGLEPEARQTLDNIRTMLHAAGASLDDVVRCLVMLEDISLWSRFNAIYVEYFGERRPARSAIGADGLALGALVEIECVAVARRDE